LESKRRRETRILRATRLGAPPTTERSKTGTAPPRQLDRYLDPFCASCRVGKEKILFQREKGHPQVPTLVEQGEQYNPVICQAMQLMQVYPRPFIVQRNLFVTILSFSLRCFSGPYQWSVTIETSRRPTWKWLVIVVSAC
jgi:hypothetical protein